MKRPLLLAAAALLAAHGVASAQQVIYSNAPVSLDPNYSSLGFQATSTNEWGDDITFAAGTSRNLLNARVVMSDWALRSNYVGTVWDVPDGFTVPITLTLYAFGDGNAPGAAIATRTVNQFIAWRPEDDPACGPLGGFGTNCYAGLAQSIMFDLTGVTVPDRIIFGVSFNTETWGYNPIGAPGPYNSLNIGAFTTLTVGTRNTPDDTYWANRFLTSNNNGVFLRDQGGWADFAPMVEFTAQSTVPEPATYAMLGAGLLVVGFTTRRLRNGKPTA